MNQGALIFAINSGSIDYVAMAAWNAQNIKKFLNLPTAVVVAKKEHAQNYNCFSHIIEVGESDQDQYRFFEDINNVTAWRNANRTDAYALSPWTQTLLLDADYVVNSNCLKYLFSTDLEFSCYRYALDAKTGLAQEWDLNWFGQYKFPQWWATVIYFRKTDTSARIFDCMAMIKHNWTHYRDLYGVSSKIYRNDYALSMALNIVSGHCLMTHDIPGCLITLTPDVQIQRQHNSFYIQYQDTNNRARYNKLTNCDFHVMGKKYLGDLIENDRRTGLFDPSHQQ